MNEDDLIGKIKAIYEKRARQPALPEIWIGDDAAVVLVGDTGRKDGFWEQGRSSNVSSPHDLQLLLMSTDAVVEGVHVDLDVCTLGDMGWKALSVAVSDIAAMGGRPLCALVTVCSPRGADIEVLSEGLADASLEWDCPVVGGDLSAASEISVVVMVTGTLGTSNPPAVLRSGANPGDYLMLTGPCGASAAGLRLLRQEKDESVKLGRGSNLGTGGGSELGSSNRWNESVSNLTEDILKSAYRRPRARLKEGWHARLAGATSLMDISDGVSIDLIRMARASNVGLEIDHIPVVDGATIDEALGGGEDYELLLATPDPGRVSLEFDKAGLRHPITIGRCTDLVGNYRMGTGELLPTGWSHF